MIKDVLFDFDGVIARTLPYHLHAWNIVLKPLNLKLKLSEIAVEEGSRAGEIISRIFKQKKIDMSESEIDNLVEKKRKIYQRTANSAIYPEVQDFLVTVRKFVPHVALVTGAIIKDMYRAVNKDFLHNFDLIITADDVVHAKPDPEPYLTAAERLSLKPNQCMVIENAPLGIQSAKKAGMHVVALKTTIKNEHILAEADFIFNRLTDINFKDLLHKINSAINN